ncbi:hypothetical protein LIA77_08109 [Sarocladium implicatum]|nr:hypothetical protein LIA77_08109 [Sarocladium implicatum]
MPPTRRIPVHVLDPDPLPCSCRGVGTRSRTLPTGGFWKMPCFARIEIPSRLDDSLPLKRRISILDDMGLFGRSGQGVIVAMQRCLLTPHRSGFQMCYAFTAHSTSPPAIRSACQNADGVWVCMPRIRHETTPEVQTRTCEESFNNMARSASQ